MKTFECISAGRVEVLEGEARSAEVVEGDKLISDSETEFRYNGKLELKNKNSIFTQAPGVGGSNLRLNKSYSGSDFISAIMKENVDRQPDDFWATWREVK